MYKYGFVIAVGLIVLSQIFSMRDRKEIKELEHDAALKDNFIDSVLILAQERSVVVVQLQEQMQHRVDSIVELQRVDSKLLRNYEKKVATNRYRTVVEFEGYIAKRYPGQRGDSAQVESGADY